MTTGNVGGPEEGSGDTAQNQETPAERRMARWTIVVGIFTALLFLTSAFSDYVIWRQLDGSNRADVFAQNQQRAFFARAAMIQVPGIDPKTRQKSLGFIVRWQNIGATRAENTWGWGSIQYFPDQVPYNFDTTRPRSEVARSFNVIGPNQPLDVNPLGLTASDSIEAEKGGGIILMWGAMQYSDIYHPEIVRHDRFCVRLTPAGETDDATTHAKSILWQGISYRDDCNKTE